MKIVIDRKMKISVIYLLLFIAPIYTYKAYSQENLSLEECKKRALEHNQNIKLANADMVVSEQDLKLSKRSLLPKFDLEASYLYRQNPMIMDIPGYELPTTNGQPSGVYYPASKSNLQYNNTYNANIKMSLPLYLGGKLKNAKRISEYAYNISGLNVQLNKTDVLLNIETQYWSFVSLLEHKSVVVKSIEFLTDVVKEVTSRYQTGIVTKNELLKVKVELNNANLSLINISNNIQLAKMSLNQAMGLEINHDFVLADSVLYTPYNQTSLTFNQNSLSQRKELQILKNQIDITEMQKKITRSNYLPQIVSFVQYGYQNPNHISQDKGELTYTAGISLSFPLFHWGEKRSKMLKINMINSKSKLRFEQTKEYLTLEVNQAIFNLKESIINVGFTSESLQQARENLQLETNRLNQGLTTTTDLMNAQLQWQKSQADHIAAKASVKINEALYLKSIGRLLPE